MRYNTKKEKEQKVAEIVANIPVGTTFVEYFTGFKGRHKVSEGVVIGHTKSGNIKLQSNHGTRMKTAYHFQKVNKAYADGTPRTFYVAGSHRNFVVFS